MRQINQYRYFVTRNCVWFCLSWFCYQTYIVEQHLSGYLVTVRKLGKNGNYSDLYIAKT